MTEQIEKAIIYPAGLSEKDIELINRQCELQRATSKGEVEGFSNAYVKAKVIAENAEQFALMTEEDVQNLIYEFAVIIVSDNKKGYRTVPAELPNFNFGVEPDKITQAMKSFCMLYAENIFEPLEAYAEFEKIHPFEDGNGRIGDLLWKMSAKRKTGKWPEELPPDIFNNKPAQK